MLRNGASRECAYMLISCFMSSASRWIQKLTQYPESPAASRAASSSMMTEQDRSSSDKCDVRMDNAIFIDVLVPELHLYTLSRLTGLE